MAKILTDKEMIDIIKRAPEEIDDGDQYLAFLESLGDLIAEHFGGKRGGVDFEEELGYNCAFHVSEEVPSDGGVFQKYDRDVLWIDGRETEYGGMRRIAWLTSSNFPSYVHATKNGVDTVCGDHDEYVKKRVLVKIPDKKLRKSDYCEGCFESWKKSDIETLEWDKRCKEII